MTDQQIADYSSDRDSGPVVHMMWRLKDSLVAQQKATNRLTRWIVALTVLIAILATVQVIPIIRHFF